MLVLVLVDVVVMAGVWTAVEFAPSTPVTRANADEVRFVKDSLRADQLRRQVVTTGPFVPPADGNLSKPRVVAVIDVWNSVDPSLAKAHDELWDTFYLSPSENAARSAKDREAAERATRKRDVSINVRAMPDQVAILNRHAMSLAEYEWTRAAALDALVQMQNEDLARMVSEGNVSITGPPVNTEEVLSHGKPASGALGRNVALLRTFKEPEKQFKNAMIGF